MIAQLGEVYPNPKSERKGQKDVIKIWREYKNKVNRHILSKQTLKEEGDYGN
jgi:hypothetical protein